MSRICQMSRTSHLSSVTFVKCTAHLTRLSNVLHIWHVLSNMTHISFVKCITFVKCIPHLTNVGRGTFDTMVSHTHTCEVPHMCGVAWRKEAFQCVAVCGSALQCVSASHLCHCACTRVACVLQCVVVPCNACPHPIYGTVCAHV